MKSVASELVCETISVDVSVSTKPKALKANKWRSMLIDVGCVSALLVTLYACFSKTIFANQSVSRLALVPEWDSLFHQFRQGASSLYDPSLIQLFAPNYFLVAKTFQSGHLPLWNPYCGFGAPLLGDIQASVFSPLRLLFNAAPGIQSWNWMLFGELSLCIVSTYALARYLRLGRAPSLFAALMYTFCPFNMWYLELNLGTASCIFPLNFLLFARAARTQTTASYIMAGVGAAFLILSGHPESAFFGITFGSLLMLFMIQLDPSRTLGDLTRFFTFCRGITIAAITTVALTAPVLFPFVEYLLNSETYKYVSVCSAHVPWPGLVQHLLNPSSGAASPFAGIVTAICLPLALLAPFRTGAKNRVESTSLILLAVLAFLVTSQLGQLESLFSHPPLTTIITRYCLPVFLLTCPLLAGLGITELFRNEAKDSDRNADSKQDHSTAHSEWKTLPIIQALQRRKLQLQLLLVSTVFCVALPWLLQNNDGWLKLCSFDLMLPAATFNSIAWKRDVICAASVVALAMLAYVLRRKRIACSLLGTLVLVPAMVSIGTAARNSLPPQSSFDYPMVEPLPRLQDPNWRSLSTREHVFRAGTNAIYGVQDLQVHNPIFPRRYLSLIKACGAKVDLFNQKFDCELSPLLSITSGKYFLAQQPVSFAGAKRPAAQSLLASPLTLASDLTLTEAAFWHQGTAAGGTLAWSRQNKVQRSNASNTATTPSQYSFAPVLFNKAGGVIWFGDQTEVTPATTQDFLIPVPQESVTKNERLTLGLQVFDRARATFVLPVNSSAREKSTTAINLGTFTPSFDTAPDNTQPLLVSETGGHVRLYENPRALPRAYVVYQSKLALGPDQSLHYLQSPQFAPHKEAIIEPNQINWPWSSISPPDDLFKLAVAQAAQTPRPKLSPLELPSPVSANVADDTDAYTKCQLEQQGPNQVTTRFKATSPGFLVLTDVFYPGWNAYLDGVETPIMHANYAFRAVRVPQGNHTVTFRYDPVSFKLGICCFALFVLGLLVAATRKYISPTKR